MDFIIFCPVVPAGLADGFEGDEPHDFRAGDADAPLPGLLPGRLQDLVGRGHPEIGEVHADLGPVVLVDDPADGLDVLERSIGEDVAGGIFGIDLQILVPGPEVPAVDLPVVGLQLLEGTAHEVTGAAGVGSVLREIHHLALVVEGFGVPRSSSNGPAPGGHRRSRWHTGDRWS